MTSKRTYSLLAPPSLGVTLTEALSWGIKVFESTRRCLNFDDLIAGGPCREIGYLVWTATSGYSVWASVDATRDDLTALLAKARDLSVYAPDPLRSPAADSFYPVRKRPGRYFAPVSRRLSDYGDDLHLVAKIPDTVAERAPSTAPIDRVAR